MSPSIFASAAIAAGLLASTTSADFIYGSSRNNIIYWGQGTNQIPLSQVCSDPTVDVVNIAFIDGFPATVGEYPASDLANACWAEWYPDPKNSSQPSKLLSTCHGVEDAINACQAANKKVLLSLGGASGEYYFASKAVAQWTAQFLLGAFGPVTDAWTTANNPRPFGNAVFDGFDLDLEATTATVTAPEMYQYYSDFINAVKGAQPGMLISGSPQCIVKDGVFQNIVPNAHFDWLSVQFYNTPQCSARVGYTDENSTSTDFTFDQWVSFVLQYSPSTKIVMGLPAGTAGAGANYASHYLSPVEANSLVRKYQSKYPSSFGGVMLWEATVNVNNVVNKQAYSYWTRAILDGVFWPKYNGLPATSSSSRASSSTRASSSSTRVSSSTRASSSTRTSSSVASSTRASSSVASSTRASSSVASSTRVSSSAASSTRAASSSAASSTRASSSVASSTRAASSSAASSTRAASSSVASSTRAASSSAASSPAASSTPASSISARGSASSVASISLTSIYRNGVSLSSSGAPLGASTVTYSASMMKSSSAPYPIANVSSSASTPSYPITYGISSQAAVTTPCSTAQSSYPVQGQAYSQGQAQAYSQAQAQAYSQGQAYSVYSANGNYNTPPAVTKTPSYGYETSPSSSTTTTITTTYVDVCETGLVTKTAYITKTVCLSCAKPTTTPGCPEGWTTSVYVSKTVTMTITKPITATNVGYVPSSPSQPAQPNYPQGGYPVSNAQPSVKSYPAAPKISTKVITMTKVATPYSAVPYASTAVPYIPATPNKPSAPAYVPAPNAPSAVPYVPSAKNATTPSTPAGYSASSSKPYPAQYTGAASRVGTGVFAVFVIVAGFFLL